MQCFKRHSKIFIIPVLIFFLLVPIFYSTPSTVYAQTTQEDPTDAYFNYFFRLICAFLPICPFDTAPNTSGTPIIPTGTQPTIPIAPTSAAPTPLPGSVLSWGQEINAALERGRQWNYFNRQQKSIRNASYQAAIRSGVSTADLYWCTTIIIDAYRLAGFGGLDLSHQSVQMMRRFFASSGNYRYIDYRSPKQSSLTQVKAGDTMILQSVFDVHNGKEHVAMVKHIDVDERCNGFIETYEANSSEKTHRFPLVGCTVKNTPYQVVAFAGIK